MRKIIFLFLIAIVSISCKSKEEAQLIITPIEHGTAVFTFGDETVYIDPTGSADAFANFSAPSYIFITDIHGDHLSVKTLKSLDLSETTIVAPKTVADRLSEGIAKEIIIIPEMRALKNIDKAFICMNLPYTMTVESAADAVLAFLPKEVFPYHYRGTGGLSNVAKFKSLVNAGNPNIKVIQLNWYPNQK